MVKDNFGSDKTANSMAKEAVRALNRAERATKLAANVLLSAREAWEAAKSAEAGARVRANSRIAYAETFKNR